ncbi:MAG: M17 family peptidase N-terminal domain-containing protein, partial [Gemmatimonadales bacterium]
MSLVISVVAATPAQHATPLLAVAVPVGGMPASLSPLDAATGGAIQRLFASGDFTGKKDELAVLHPVGPAPRIVMVGLGKPADLGRTAVRRAAGAAAKRARTIGVPHAAFYLTPEGRGALSAQEVGQVVAEGLGLGAWHYAELKQPPEEKKPALERFTILAPEDTAQVEKGHAIGAAVAAGQA